MSTPLIPLHDLVLGPAEEAAVARVLRSGWLSMGDVTREFEARFAAAVGCPHAVAVNSGTAALHLALLAAGVGAGDDVLCPALTFVATANAIRYCGARPVFADVASLDEWNVSAETLQAAATEKTRAVVVVHYAGYPCPMEPIRALARERGWAVIEDAAHAPGAALSGTSAGAWGDAGCFSFFANKNLTTGEGGMVTTQRDDLADRLRRLRSHGMTTLTLERHRGHAFAYDVTDLGYNYRMGELNAALGLAQLERLEQNNRARGALVALYRQRLESCSGLAVPFDRPPGLPAYHLMPVLLPPGCDRQRVMGGLRAAGIQTSIHYRPVDTFTAYVNAGLGPCPGLENTHRIGEGVLTLPLYPSMTREQVSCVCEALALSV